MKLDKLPGDIWRVISKYLTKRDLLTLQFVNHRLFTRLDTLADIWWGKHNSDYQKHWNEYYNNVPKTSRDRKLERMSREYNWRIIKDCQRECKHWYGPGVSTVKGLFASHDSILSQCSLQKRQRAEDIAIFHVWGSCFQCDYC